MRGIIVFIALLFSANSSADTPFYVGAGWGWQNIEVNQGLLDRNQKGGALELDHSLDETTDGITLFAGYEVNQRWVLEVGYIDFGTADSTSDLYSPEPLPIVGDIRVPDASKLELEIDGYYLNTQYHVPIGSYGSFDLIGGWFFADAELRETRLLDTLGGLAPELQIDLDDDRSKDKNGAMLGVAYTHKLTHTIYARGALTYFDIDYSGNLDEPIRLGIDIIWDF